MKKLTKNRIVIDTGALLEYLKLVLDSYHHKLNEENQNRLIQLLELFKGRELIIVPQVLSETYSLLKKEAKRSDSQIKHWLEILEDPYLKGLLENYIQKDEIMKEKKYLDFGFTDIALMKSINDSNFLLTIDYLLTQFCRYKGLEAYHLEEILL